MAKAGETPELQFKQGDSLEYGQASAANQLMAMIPPPPADTQEFAPANPEDKFLTSPTDRPGEPLTAGAPFGPGPNASKLPLESDQEVVARVAQQASVDPAAPPVLKEFARRVQQGQ